MDSKICWGSSRIQSWAFLLLLYVAFWFVFEPSFSKSFVSAQTNINWERSFSIYGTRWWIICNGLKRLAHTIRFLIPSFKIYDYLFLIVPYFWIIHRILTPQLYFLASWKSLSYQLLFCCCFGYQRTYPQHW